MKEECKRKCPDCYMKKILLYNRITHKYFKPHCKTYTCPEHGWKKKRDLEKGIAKWLESFKTIRLITFTVRFEKGADLDLHNYKVQKAWHRFITELRRNSIFSRKEKDTQYVKVYEYHKSGALHIHALFSNYIHWTKLQAIWQSALEVHFEGAHKLGNVNAKGGKSPKSGAKYLAKYVVKMANTRKSRIRSWSKSGRVAIFEKKDKQEGWMILQKDSVEGRMALLGIPILERGSVNVTDAPRKKRPPDPNWTSDYEYYSWDDKIYRFSDQLKPQNN